MSAGISQARGESSIALGSHGNRESRGSSTHECVQPHEDHHSLGFGHVPCRAFGAGTGGHCRQEPRPSRLRGQAPARRPRTIRTCARVPRRSRRPGPRNSPAASPTLGGPGPGPRGAGGPPPGRNYARGPAPERDWGGHAYRGNRAWDGGRWRHEVRNGRSGWWWDVGGVWYYYPQRMAGPPAYISEDYYRRRAGGLCPGAASRRLRTAAASATG